MINTLNETTRDPCLQLYLDFYQHTILISYNEESLLQKMSDEFHYFVKAHVTQVDTTLEIHQSPPPEMPSMVAVKLLEHCAVYQLGTRQYVDYFGEALTIWDRSENSIQIYGMDETRLFELSFLAIHSILGQKLDQEGLCRIHALGVSLGHANVLVMLPSKGGKSTLLSHLLDHPEVTIISDDMPLVDYRGYVHPFPSKISLNQVPTTGILSQLKWHEFKRFNFSPKWTASLAQLDSRIETYSVRNRNLLIAGFRLSQGDSILSEVSKWKMITPLMEHMIMGFGLPQILEMFLKFNFTDFFKLTYHACIRSYCAFQLVRKARCFHFYIGTNKTYNAQLIIELLRQNQDT
jgi:hypothetical protein